VFSLLLPCAPTAAAFLFQFSSIKRLVRAARSELGVRRGEEELAARGELRGATVSWNRGMRRRRAGGEAIGAESRFLESRHAAAHALLTWTRGPKQRGTGVHFSPSKPKRLLLLDFKQSLERPPLAVWREYV
jgi:hypothetical protein